MAVTSAVSYNNNDGMQALSIGHSIYPTSSVSSSTAQSVVSFIAGHFGKKHDDLKVMLDSSNNSQKLEAMKRIIGMMATGKDVSELFAAVVKNVVCKNIEIKKLVYVYLVRYAEEQQDLALLSVATFQRGLKDSNQLIRASALRVLSSIRVPMIVPIMMLSLKEAVTDLSAYVRKTAANAIPKLYSMDPEQKDVLVEIIEKLLQDKTTLVAGSTVIAFELVCPEKIDLIHKNFRKLCNMLIDIDEWGQVAVINMLVRYARSQFLDPNKNMESGTDQKFYPSESEKSDSEDENNTSKNFSMDPDHRLLLKSCQPLLLSRNSAVIMAVAKLYHHIAPSSEVGLVVKALIRLLRSHREVQTVVLSNIVTLSLQRKGLFDQHLKSFFVHTSDPTHIKKLKLEILTNLANESSIPTILREFQTYIASSDKEFAAATIQSIGRCASNIPEIADTCLAGLIRMLSNRDENVVSESIIVIKKLLQMRHKDHSEVIPHMAKLLDKVHMPMARASILWLIGEYSDRIPKIAPDVLRKMAKSFASEEDVVKLQIINLGAKLYITNSKQTRTLCQYIFQLGKYDQNYDIRDRTRFLRFLLFPTDKTEGANNLKKKAKKIFLVEKPAPILQSLFKDRGQYQLSSLSHMIDSIANGYQELPEFPDVQPDPSVRNVEMETVYGNQFLLSKEKMVSPSTKEKDKDFYTSEEDEEDEEEDESGEDSSSEEDNKNHEKETSSESNDEKEDSGEESEFEELSESEEEKVIPTPKKSLPESSEDESSEEESEEETSEEESEEESDDEVVQAPVKHKAETTKKVQVQNPSDMLLDLNDFSVSPKNDVNINLVPSLVSDMESLSVDPKNCNSLSLQSSQKNSKSFELLSKINGKGLIAYYRFPRTPCIYSGTMVAVEMEFTNSSNADVKRLRIENKKLLSGALMQEFNEVASISPKESITVTVGIDFKDTVQPVTFDLCTESGKFTVQIKVPVGELMRGVSLTQHEFTTQQKKLTGMTESKLACHLTESLPVLVSKIIEAVSMTQSPTVNENVLRFSANLISSGLPVLLSIKNDGNNSQIIVNLEKISIGSLLVKEIKNALQ
ncbi:AP-3 complex subunit beta-1 isoform X1 [Hydra vulgaris]|uniref:AP-3 complex subunit beta-1 isoform X1 n=1 Tax=Hydra vulgaris TaxID=6087 RepID=UPI001F5F756B|nr:AP-3 complex subunit beta-1 isoform X1 [Hydra vulgaris]